MITVTAPIKKPINFKLIIAIIAIIYFWHYTSQYHATDTFWDSLDLVFHEAGHTLLMFFGDWLYVAGGTILQLAIPALCSVYFFYQKQPYSGSLVLFWLSQSFLNVYIYSADALKMELPLLGGDGVGHDWNIMLSNAGLLDQTAFIAGFFYTLALISLCSATVGSLYFSLNEK